MAGSVFWIKVESHEERVAIEEVNGTYRIDLGGEVRIVDCQNAGHRDYLSLIIDDESYLVESAPVKVDEGLYQATINGRRYEVEVLDERLAATRRTSAMVKDTGPYVVTSPMPGMIVDVHVKVGDEVKAGTPIVVMEAMKMQNELVSEIDGIVRAVNIHPREAVDSQAPLIEIERSE